MYQMLMAGKLGNRNLVWGECNAPLWGIRSKDKAGDPRCGMYIPTAEVPGRLFPGADVSVMVDCVSTVLAMMNIVESPDLRIYARVPPIRGVSWRAQMEGAPEYRGVRARVLLRELLNGNSYDDVCELLSQYPEHVIELSVLDRCFGSVPGRNAVIWEVRTTTGQYEEGWGT